MTAVRAPEKPAPSVTPLPPEELAGGAYPLWHPMTHMPTFLSEPITIVGGEGSTVWDEDGRRYLSAAAGLWNVSCGFRRPEIERAIVDQLERLPYGTLFRFANEPAVQLARRLAELAPGNLTRTFLSSSGAGAVEAAIKIARRHFFVTGRPQRRIVVALSEGYHGTSIGAGAVTGEDLGQQVDGVDRREVRFIPTPHRRTCAACGGEPACPAECARELVELVHAEGERIAAIVLEPILGSAGVVVLPDEFLQVVVDVCREHGILLVCDEVATGFGRTGRMFASELLGLEPDLMTLSKGINSGYLPLGATLLSEDVFAPILASGTLFAHGETQAGNPLSCAAALATLEVIERDGLVAHAAAVGAHLRGRLRELEGLRHVAEVRGHGLMLGIELVADPRAATPPAAEDVWLVVGECLRRGLIVHPAPAGVSLFPPLVLTFEEADRIADVLVETIGALRLG
jgi:adenosylmethionine-8-amino-7-oxononanoate aminotransferase